MRHSLILLALVLAGLVALPLSASAQAGEEGTSAEPSAEEPTPSSEPAPTSEPAPQEPALQLELDDAGVGVAPGYPPRFDELELRVKRAKIGFGASAGVFLAGFVTGSSIWLPLSPSLFASSIVRPRPQSGSIGLRGPAQLYCWQASSG